MTRPQRRMAWLVGGVVFLGVAAVAVSVSAWAGLVAALLLSAVQFTIAARMPGEPAPPAE